MLPSNEIKPLVQKIADAIVKDSGKQRPEDLASAAALVELVSSTLECLHDMAYYMYEENHRALRRGE